MINWHRLFGLALGDYFTGTQYSVEMEKDVARKRQVLDVVIVRGTGEALVDPCDGLEDLRPHNLLTYKSGQESLDTWAIEELIGHYVNYRKAFAPRESAGEFGLYAVTTRRPRALAEQVALEAVKPGVYRLRVVGRTVTLICLREVEPCPRNALWEIFSFEAAKVVAGAGAYRWRQDDQSYTFQDFRRDLARETLPELTPEERVRGLPPEERVRGLLPEERVRGLPPEERVRGLPPEERVRGLPPEERVRGLLPEERVRGLLPEELVRSLRTEDRLLGLSDEELVRLKDLLERRTSGQR